MIWNSVRRRPLLGIELSARELRLVRLEPRRQSPRLAQVAREALPEGAVEAGRIADADAVADGLQRLLGDETAGRFRVATALAGDAVIVKRLTLAEGPARQWPARLRAEAAQWIPFAPEEVSLDYHLLGERDGARDLLLVAAKRDLVEQMTAGFAAAGLTVSIVDHKPFAVQNCYEFNYQPEPEAAAVLLHLGAQVSHLSWLRGLEPLISRTVGVGSRQWEGGAANQQAAVTAMRQEIRKTRDFLADAPAPAPQRVYLAGAPDPLPGLEAALAEEFQADVEALDPFRRFAAEGELPAGAEAPDRARYSVPTGLALRGWAA